MTPRREAGGRPADPPARLSAGGGTRTVSTTWTSSSTSFTTPWLSTAPSRSSWRTAPAAPSASSGSTPPKRGWTSAPTPPARCGAVLVAGGKYCWGEFCFFTSSPADSLREAAGLHAGRGGDAADRRALDVGKRDNRRFFAAGPFALRRGRAIRRPHRYSAPPGAGGGRTEWGGTPLSSPLGKKRDKIPKSPRRRRGKSRGTCVI